MKLKSSILFGALALTVGQASAATRVFNITGATAFRASANNAIISILGGATTKFAFTGTQGVSGTNRAIFVGTMAAFPGDTIIVRAHWSGSTQGIIDVVDNNSIQFVDDNVRTDGTPGAGNPVAVAPGYNLGGAGLDAAEFENATPQWSFSDVDKLLSERPNATLGGGPVGVVPFMFLAGEGSPVELDNMTDQLHKALWSTGQLPIAFFTGNTADTTTVVATGRNNGSGTRATILAETEFGAFTSVTQFGATFTGSRTEAYPTAKLLTLTEFGNGGNSSNSGVREILTRRPDVITFDSDGAGPELPAEVDIAFVSYLTISDANSAITEGAKEMTYNGVNFSPENVKKGLYSLWGYQQFYLDDDATTQEGTFDTAFRGAIPATLDGTNAIAISDMSVDRTGGDGGPITPRTNYPLP